MEKNTIIPLSWISCWSGRSKGVVVDMRKRLAHDNTKTWLLGAGGLVWRDWGPVLPSDKTKSPQPQQGPVSVWFPTERGMCVSSWHGAAVTEQGVFKAPNKSIRATIQRASHPASEHGLMLRCPNQRQVHMSRLKASSGHTDTSWRTVLTSC